MENQIPVSQLLCPVPAVAAFGVTPLLGAVLMLLQLAGPLGPFLLPLHKTGQHPKRQSFNKCISYPMRGKLFFLIAFLFFFITHHI